MKFPLKLETIGELDSGVIYFFFILVTHTINVQIILINCLIYNLFFT